MAAHFIYLTHKVYNIELSCMNATHFQETSRRVEFWNILVLFLKNIFPCVHTLRWNHYGTPDNLNIV